MMKSNRHHSPSGLTLVEILIVVGIVAFIAAITIPVFFSVREQGRRTTCLSNERQIGMAMFQYVEDNDGVFPTSGLFESSWISLVFPYLKSKTIFACPDDETQVPQCYPGLFVDSYGMNSNVMGHSVTVEKQQLIQPAVSQGALVSPSHTVMLFEVTNIADALDATPQPGTKLPGTNSAFGNMTAACAGFPCGIGLDLYRVVTPYGSGFPLYATGDIGGRTSRGNYETNQGYLDTPRHNGGSDFLACDGHAQWLPGKDVSGGRTAPAADCDQGTVNTQPTDCIERGHGKPQLAAGTECPKFILTLSIK